MPQLQKKPLQNPIVAVAAVCDRRNFPSIPRVPGAHIAVSINISTNVKPVVLTCGFANPAAQQRRPTTRCANVVVICYRVPQSDFFSGFQKR